MQLDLMKKTTDAFYLFKHYFDNHSIEMQQRDATIAALREDLSRIRARATELSAKLKVLGVNEPIEEIDPSILEHIKG